MSFLTQDFTKFKGDAYIIRFLIEDAESLDGFSAHWNVTNDDPDDNAAFTTILTKTSAVGGGITFVQNYVEVSVVSTDTDEASTVAAGVYHHELNLVDSAGKPNIAAIGVFTLKAPVKKK